MNEWWTMHDGTLIGAIGGSACGVLGGVFGAMIGWLAPRGVGGRVVVPIHIGCVVLGAATLIVGVAALVTGQPRHVFYPLLLIGGIVTFVMGGLLPVVIARYRQADTRKMDAQLLRKG
jgi:hypothetical protein